jgi:hypothetical protein
MPRGGYNDGENVVTSPGADGTVEVPLDDTGAGLSPAEPGGLYDVRLVLPLERSP